ncbi:AMP-dependent synthetase/ligase [Propionibacterium sp.]|uniref:AMP-dependent synthetase/ligase n=1 Tax=Propionibacterium sp. TaxID=1977903 RepID=UPI0039ED8549
MTANRPPATARNHVAHMFRATVQRYGDRPATRVREGKSWKTTSYQQLDDRATQIACALIHAGVDRGDRVAICARNRPEWAQVDAALMLIGAVSVPLYATNSVELMVAEMTDCGAVLAFGGSAEEASRLFEASGQIPTLRRVVSFDDCDVKCVAGLEQFAPIGQPASPEMLARVDERLALASPDDLYSIIYTSGTTGEPKGVMISHRAMTSQFDALDKLFTIRPEDSSLCFLPLSHAFERGWSTYLWSHGCMNTYLPDTRQIAEMMVLARTNLMVGVPKLFEAIAEAARKKASASAVKKRVFDWAIWVGTRARMPGHSRVMKLLARIQLPLADVLVLRSIRNAIGGPKKVLASGGAPLRREVEVFFAAIGVNIRNGYGMTEASPLISFNGPGATREGSVGKVMPGGQVRLGDEDEIQYCGPNLMDGYWQHPDATREALLTDASGTWLRTGDVGFIDDDGYLYVTDRIKDIIVTNGGKNVAPQPIEELLLADPLFEYAVLFGDNKPFLTLILRPSLPNLSEIAESLEVSYKEVGELLTDTRINAELRARAAKLTEKLPKYMQFREMRISLDDFSVANGLLTPTLKVRRGEVEKHFHELIEEMYPKAVGAGPGA